jgi:hypothetical protein
MAGNLSDRLETCHALERLGEVERPFMNGPSADWDIRNPCVASLVQVLLWKVMSGSRFSFHGAQQESAGRIPRFPAGRRETAAHNPPAGQGDRVWAHH